MIIKGKYNSAQVFVDSLDHGSYEQIQKLCDQDFLRDSKIVIMPDVHVGKGSTIGTTMTIHDKVVPNLVGVDIGCGLIVLKLKERAIDYKKLDEVIKRQIPSGFSIRNTRHNNTTKLQIDNLIAKDHVDLDRGYLSLGTLGGGNHFIEINENTNHEKYCVIHSGSRHIGLQIAQHYQQLAIQSMKAKDINISDDLAYLEGKLMDDYLHDMKIIQEFAWYNRQSMADEIIKGMNFKVLDSFQTIHNYIDTKEMILRKGAVSSQKDEIFILPLNMRDGSVILKGKGNPDWNYSAPHGAGRIMSRTQARKRIRLSDYQESMKGIYSSMISHHTLDEAPMAYKDGQEILNLITPTADILEHLKVTYNFKAK